MESIPQFAAEYVREIRAEWEEVMGRENRVPPNADMLAKDQALLDKVKKLINRFFQVQDISDKQYQMQDFQRPAIKEVDGNYKTREASEYKENIEGLHDMEHVQKSEQISPLTPAGIPEVEGLLRTFAEIESRLTSPDLQQGGSTRAESQFGETISDSRRPESPSTQMRHVLPSFIPIEDYIVNQNVLQPEVLGKPEYKSAYCPADKRWYTVLFPALQPGRREDVQLLADWLQHAIQKNKCEYSDGRFVDVEAAFVLHSIAFLEIVRQVVSENGEGKPGYVQEQLTPEEEEEFQKLLGIKSIKFKVDTTGINRLQAFEILTPETIGFLQKLPIFEASMASAVHSLVEKYCDLTGFQLEDKKEGEVKAADMNKTDVGDRVQKLEEKTIKKRKSTCVLAKHGVPIGFAKLMKINVVPKNVKYINARQAYVLTRSCTDFYVQGQHVYTKLYFEIRLFSRFVCVEGEGYSERDLYIYLKMLQRAMTKVGVILPSDQDDGLIFINVTQLDYIIDEPNLIDFCGSQAAANDLILKFAATHTISEHASPEVKGEANNELLKDQRQRDEFERLTETLLRTITERLDVNQAIHTFQTLVLKFCNRNKEEKAEEEEGET